MRNKNIPGLLLILVFFFIIFAVNALPSVTILSPLNNTYTTENYTYINLTSTEELNQSLLEWGNSSGFTNVSMTNTTLIDWSHNMTDLNISYHTYNYTIWAQNTTGNWSQSDRYFVILNTLPTATSAVIASSDGQNLTNSTITSSFTYADADGDANQANHTKWYIDGVENSTFENATSILAGNTTKGQNWSFSVKTYDGYNWSSSWLNSTNLTILNTAPTTTNPTLSPTSAYKNTSLISCLNGTTSDEDSDTITFYYLWYINNSASAITTQNITNSSFAKGYNLTCQITANDGTSNSSSYNSTNLTVGDLPPTLPVQGLLANNTNTTDNTPFFNWTASSDADEDTRTYGIEIYNSIGSLNQSNYTLTDNNYTSSTLADGNYTWRIKAITTDANSSWTGNLTFTIDTISPTNITTVSPTLSNNSYTNQSWVYINATFNETNPSACLLSFNNGTAANYTMTKSALNCYLNMSNQSDGPWNYTIYINDSAGNWGSNGTFFITVDTVKPILTNVTSSSINHNSAVITWITNETANSTVYYGTTTNTTSNSTNSSYLLNHSITLSLSASTLYYFNVSSCDYSGNCNTSIQYNFTTTLRANGVSCSAGAECTGGYCCSSVCSSSACTYGSGGGGGGSGSGGSGTTNNTTSTPTCKSENGVCINNSDCCSGLFCLSGTCIKQFVPPINQTNQTNQTSNETQTLKELAEEKIEEAWTFLEKAKMEGNNTEEAEGLLSLARLNYERGDYQDAISKAARAVGAIGPKNDQCYLIGGFCWYWWILLILFGGFIFIAKFRGGNKSHQQPKSVYQPQKTAYQQPQTSYEPPKSKPEAQNIQKTPAQTEYGISEDIAIKIAQREFGLISTVGLEAVKTEYQGKLYWVVRFISREGDTHELLMDERGYILRKK